MKKFALIAALATAGAFSAAHAGEQKISNKLDVQEVRESAQMSYSASRSVFREVRGRYEMEDGTTLSLYQDGARFIAEISGAAPIEVRAASNNRLVAVAGGTQLAFKQNAAGLYSGVVMSKANG